MNLTSTGQAYRHGSIVKSQGGIDAIVMAKQIVRARQMNYKALLAEVERLKAENQWLHEHIDDLTPELQKGLAVLGERLAAERPAICQGCGQPLHCITCETSQPR